MNKTVRREHLHNFTVYPLYSDWAPAWANFLQKAEKKRLGGRDSESGIEVTYHNRAQRELITKLFESLTVDNKPASPSLMEKMKVLFN